MVVEVWKSQSVICKPQNQHGQCYNSVWVWRPENQGSNGASLRIKKAQGPGDLMSKGRRKWTFRLKRERIHLSFAFLFHLGPQWIGWCLLSLRADLVTQFTESNANLLRHILTDAPRTNVLPTIWASYRPDKLTNKINYHIFVIAYDQA